MWKWLATRLKVRWAFNSLLQKNRDLEIEMASNKVEDHLKEREKEEVLGGSFRRRIEK